MALRREPVRAQAREEHRRPLHALGLVHGRDRRPRRAARSRVGVRLRVVVGRLVLSHRERLVLPRWVGVEVDLLEVGDGLAELAELVEDQLAAHRVAGHGLLAQLERLEELQVQALDVVDAPALAAVEVAAFVEDPDRGRPVAVAGTSSRRPTGARRSGLRRSRPCSGRRRPRLDLGAVEESVESLDDVRDVPPPHLLDKRSGVLRDRAEQHREVRPGQAARLALCRVI